MAQDIRWSSKKFDDLSKDELYCLLKLRLDVFVVEQRRPVADLNNRDRHPGTLHVLGTKGSEVVAYARVVPPQVSYSEVSIERVVVDRNLRRFGLGKVLMEKAVTESRRNFPGEPITLHAQQYLEKFYGSFGFSRTGDIFDEDGIPHVMMIGK